MIEVPLRRARVVVAHALIDDQDADRKDIGRLIEWSARRDLAAGVDPEDAAQGVVFGSRRAA